MSIQGQQKERKKQLNRRAVRDHNDGHGEILPQNLINLF